VTPRRPFAIYAITKHGVAIARRALAQLSEADLFVSDKLRAASPGEAKPLPLPMGPLLADTFLAYDCHVFIISVGAVVRMIAPLLKNKKVDPAVLCIDDANRFTICVLSGHVGRGNAFTERVATVLQNQAVITTASDAIGTLTVDILGRDLGWTLDDMDRNVTRGCAAVVNAAPVLFVQEAGEPNWWPQEKPLPEGIAYATSLDGVDAGAFEILLVATDRDIRDSHFACWNNSVIYRPKTLALGIGCDRGTPPDLVERGVAEMLAKHRLSAKSVKCVASIEQKSDEPAILELGKRNGWPLLFFNAEELDGTPGIASPSEVVKRHVGSRGVAEPAALKASGAERLLVEKQIYTEPGAGRSMTFAVARIPFPPRSITTTAGGAHG
jgi:cobalt-precorrin 5A hydrolase